MILVSIILAATDTAHLHAILAIVIKIISKCITSGCGQWVWHGEWLMSLINSFLRLCNFLSRSACVHLHYGLKIKTVP